MMKLDINALSYIGLLREHNEDMVSLGGILLRNEEMAFPVELADDSQFYLLVSDGMGGHEQGDRASHQLLEFLDACFKDNAFAITTFEEDLRDHVRQFSDDLNRCAIEEHQRRPMGCTLTGVVWTNGKAFLVNAGDSRTYRYRNGILRQLTVDETVRGITGVPTDSKALLNCIGAGADARLTVEDITERLHDGDMLLVCSDGLTDMVDDMTIEEILAQSHEPTTELYSKACQNGGYDNVSVVVAKIVMS